ncbi:ABC transporter ATP-binding protein [Streptomyces kebangsaanensis]|uniref:ABC transporter ATP-binding protein n=1 Tax=Streptomyces kebangsaanensis TaxID=864058 RepID=UPI00093C28FA|nr:ATP-binding cassette domain-containing protein [Streptomyces kebangsaanensis]
MIQAFGLTSDSRKDLPPAVDDVSFEAHAGRVTVLLGAAGAGKTTTLRLMLELQQGRGITYFKGRPLHRIAHPSREVGVLLGDVPGHPSRTVRGHLRMLCAVVGLPARRADEVLEVVGLVNLREERLGTLSRGMDRRLGLACALLSDPHTLVLDDPVDGLSAREGRWLHGMLRAHATQGGTVLFATADPKEAARTADRVVTLEGGRLVADQEAEDFARNRLRPRVAVRSPHAARLGALLAKEARTARHSVEVVREDGNRLSVYGSTCADIGEAAFRHGILIHQLADEVGDMGPGAGAVPSGATPAAEESWVRAAPMAGGKRQTRAAGPAAVVARTEDTGATVARAPEDTTVPAGPPQASVTAHEDSTPHASRAKVGAAAARTGSRVRAAGPDGGAPATGPAGPHPATVPDGAYVPAGPGHPDAAARSEALDLTTASGPPAPADGAEAPYPVGRSRGPNPAAVSDAPAPADGAEAPCSTDRTRAPSRAVVPESPTSVNGAEAPYRTASSEVPSAAPGTAPTPSRSGDGPTRAHTPDGLAAATARPSRPPAPQRAAAHPGTGRHADAQPSIPTPRPAEAVVLDATSPLPPPISVRPAPGPLRPLRYELRRATGIGAGFVTCAAVLVVSALTALVMGHMGHTPQPRLIAAWPQQLPLPPAALGAGLLGALASGDEFRHPALAADRGTVPRRLGLLAAKLAVATAAALMLAFLTVGCDAEVLYAVYGQELTQVPGDWLSLGASWTGLVVGCAWAGVLAAGLFRSTTAGLASVLAVPVVVVPLVQAAMGGRAWDADGLPARLRRVFLLQWPFGGDRYLAAAARVIAQPVGGALTLSLAALLCAYLLAILRGRAR